MVSARVIVVSLALAWSAGAQGADGTTVRLTSLEWAPYTGRDLPDQGLSSRVVRAALAATGYGLQIDFLPWRRAYALGLDGSQGHDGVFPVYDGTLRRGCLVSDAIGVSPLGFAERRSDPIAWTTLEDLKGLRIGVVAGYVNSAGFDAMAAAGELSTVPVDRDLLNLRRLARGRLDAAVIDALVFDFLTVATPDLRAALRMDEHLLEEKTLHVCFRPTADGRGEALRQALNVGLARLPPPPP